jgi:ankyrin repeat protein
MSTKPKIPTPPYFRLGEIYNALAQALDTKSKNRDVERLAREGDFDWSLLSGLREDLILAPLRRYVGDEAFINNLDQFIQHVHASYLRIVSSISLDSMSRDESLPILIEHYFATHAIGFFESIWTDDAPDPFSFLTPENYPLEVVYNWADPGGSHALAKAAFPESSDIALDNREKVTRWADGTQLPDLASLKLFVDALAKNGSDKQKSKTSGLLKWLLLARALTWFERKANPLHLKQILFRHICQEHREWDVGGILSQAAFQAGKKREALLEPYGRLMCNLDRTEPKAEGARAEAESALADFAQQLKTHDQEGLVSYALEWYRGRWHVLSGEYEEALKSYQLAVAHSDYRAGDTWKQIVTEALALSSYLGNAKPFLKQLKHRAIASGLIAQPGINDDVVEDWEIEELRKQFHHLFPRQGRFVEIEQPDDDVGALPFLAYDPESLANQQPNYRKPDQVVTVRTIDNQVRRWSQLSLYTTLGNVDVVKTLLEKGASVDVLDDSDGSALLSAIQRAADSNDREVLDVLLNYPHSKGTLNQSTKRKRLTPLMRAIDYGVPDIVLKLLSMGADANMRGHVDDQTPLYLCIRNMGGLRVASSLRITLSQRISSDNDLVLRETLRRYGVGIAGVFGDKRAAFEAMRNPDERDILNKVVDLIVDDFIGRHTVEKQLEIAQYLLAHGANPNASHSYPVAGRTPLMLAVENDSPEAVSLLMQRGGNPFIRDCSGHDCRVIATAFKSRNVLNHFRRIGVM